MHTLYLRFILSGKQCAAAIVVNGLNLPRAWAGWHHGPRKLRIERVGGRYYGGDFFVFHMKHLRFQRILALYGRVSLTYHLFTLIFTCSKRQYCYFHSRICGIISAWLATSHRHGSSQINHRRCFGATLSTLLRGLPSAEDDLSGKVGE